VPRAYTPAERERIRERLVQAGRDGFSRLGLSKITVAELARDAGIGKGSFYQFFASKEELFLAVQEQEEAAFKAALVRELERARSGHDAVRTLLVATATRLTDHPLLRRLLDPETLSALALRVPAERLAAHQAADRAYFEALVHGWRQRGWLHAEVEPGVVFDVLSAVFAVTLQRELFGAASMQRAIVEIAEAVAARWCPSPAAPAPARPRGRVVQNAD
jgi:AcrR family transcriptional regulator